MKIEELKALIAKAEADGKWGERALAARCEAAGIKVGNYDDGAPWMGLSIVRETLHVLEDLARIGGKAVEIGTDRVERIALLSLSIFGQDTWSKEELELMGERAQGMNAYLQGLLDGVDPDGAERRHEISLAGL